MKTARYLIEGKKEVTMGKKGGRRKERERVKKSKKVAISRIFGKCKGDVEAHGPCKWEPMVSSSITWANPRYLISFSVIFVFYRTCFYLVGLRCSLGLSRLLCRVLLLPLSHLLSKP